MTYRPDIDGLRAIAVLSVILFHFFDMDGFNGFIGVDIFFVISGYLITNIIYSDIVGQKFSLAHFYERRARRILPALTLVILSSSLIGYFLFLPEEGIPFAKSIVATSLFGSNFLFLSESGYFDSAALVKPLLHTWSLAIEEQFYIFFPIILWLIRSLSKNKILSTLCLLALASFTFNILYIYHFDDQESAFYMLITRAWELLIGSILVFAPKGKVKKQNGLAWCGVLLIILAMFLPADLEKFPGLFAILPTMGTAILLYSGSNFESRSKPHTLLSHRHCVFVGKISYSLYLWHWPIYVFAQYYWINEIAPPVLMLLIGFCFILSYLSWRFVEQPFRASNNVFNRKKIFALSFATIVASALSGVLLYSFYEKTQESSQHNTSPQIIKNIITIGSDTITIFGESTDDADAGIALWGDSHAHALIPAITHKVDDMGITGIALSKNDYLVPDAFCGVIAHKNGCQDKTEEQLEYLTSHPKIQTVVIAHRWEAWVGNWKKKALDQDAVSIMRKDSLISIINKLDSAGKRVIIVMQIPEIRQIPPNIDIASTIERINRIKRDIDLRPTLSAYQDKMKNSFDLMNTIQDDTDAMVIWPHDILCDNTYCSVVRDGKTLYKDDDHLSYDGARLVAPLIEKYIR